MRTLGSNRYQLANEVYGALGRGEYIVSPYGADLPTTGYFVIMSDGPTYNRLQDVSVVTITQWLETQIPLYKDEDLFIIAVTGEDGVISTHMGYRESSLERAERLAVNCGADAVYDIEEARTIFIKEVYKSIRSKTNDVLPETETPF